MADITRKQVGIIAIPLVLIAIMVPVAIVIFDLMGGTGNETEKPQEDRAVAGQAAPTEQGNTGTTGSVIRMDDLKFIPEEMIVDGGTELLWKNDDGSTHQIVVDGLDFHTDAILPGDEVRQDVPDKPGEYDFRCIIHPNTMQGTLTVR